MWQEFKPLWIGMKAAGDRLLVAGGFAPYTSIPTNLLFFDRTGPTSDVWYYEQPLPDGKKNYTKTSPIQIEEFADCIAWWNKRKENERAWKVSSKKILENGCNLDIKNPHTKENLEHLPPEKLVEGIIEKEKRILVIMDEIKALLAEGPKA
jgi:type I restriction enzyme M protein